jgi:hypothetical protein
MTARIAATDTNCRIVIFSGFINPRRRGIKFNHFRNHAGSLVCICQAANEVKSACDCSGTSSPLQRSCTIKSAFPCSASNTQANTVMRSLVGKPASWLGLQVLGRMPRLERTGNSLIIGFLAFAAGPSVFDTC